LRSYLKKDSFIFLMGKIVGILSLKGGVGKTSSVVSLGSCLSDLGKKVLLVDCNFSAPNLGVHLKIIDPEVTLHHVLNREANVTQSIHSLDGFDVIPSSVFYNKDINYLKLRDKISPLKRKYDVIIIDSSPALNEETLATMLASDELLVVTTPDYPTISTTLKAINLAKQRRTPINGLILNKVHNKNFELSLNDIEKTVEVPILAVIPYDINVLKALSEFTPSTVHKPNSRGSVEYKKLAAVLLGEKYNPFSIKSLFKITPRREEINRELYYKSAFD